MGDVSLVRHRLRQHGVTILGQADWADAELFVLQHLGMIRERVRWRAALSGGWLFSAGAAQGEEGIFVKYHGAIHKAGREAARRGGAGV